MPQLSRSLSLGLFAGALALRLEIPDNATLNKDNVTLNQDNVTLIKDNITLNKDTSCGPADAFRQELTNMMDLQYFTEITVGSQKIKGILDTGSFELLVFSNSCTSCGMAALFNETNSPTFKVGNDSKTHSFGSGACRTQEGSDEVGLGCFKTPRQALWLASMCQMPVLQRAGFNSIVGVGPPGQPEYTARDNIQQLDDMAAKLKAKNESVPNDILEELKVNEALLQDAIGKRSLLENLNMTTFSACLARKPGLPGYLIWNDITREGQTGVIKVPVAGNITWSIKLEHMFFEFAPSEATDVKEVTEMKVGCPQGCGAIVDTGTSLIGVPSGTYNYIAGMIEMHMTAHDCSDLSKFPTLILEIAGHKLRMPPSTYLGVVSGEPTSDLAKLMPNLRQNPRAPANSCQLLLMDLGMTVTTLGPMVILGMPLFREFYTTFDLGAGRGHRSIFLSPADESCHPDTNGMLSYHRNRDVNTEAYRPRHVELSKVRVPEWLSSGSDIRV